MKVFLHIECVIGMNAEEFWSAFTRDVKISRSAANASIPDVSDLRMRLALAAMVKSLWSKTLNTLQLRPDHSERPAGLRWRSNTFFIVATVAVGLFTDLWLYSLVVPVLPFMLQDRVGVPRNQIQSHVDGMLAAYAAASVCFSPIAGVLADRMSTRQAPFLLGVAALFGATVLLFLGTTLPVLLVARVLQGVSSAVVWTLGLALCIETVGPENLGKTIGSVRRSLLGVSSVFINPSSDLQLHFRWYSRGTNGWRRVI